MRPEGRGSFLGASDAGNSSRVVGLLRGFLRGLSEGQMLRAGLAQSGVPKPGRGYKVGYRSKIDSQESLFYAGFKR